MTSWTNEAKLQIGSGSAEFDDGVILMDDSIELFGALNTQTTWTLEPKS